MNENDNNNIKKDYKSLTIRTLIKQWDNSSWILLTVPVLLTVWVYFCKQDFFDETFGIIISLWNQDLFNTVYEYLGAFILMFVVPFVLVKFIFKERLRDYGFKMGDTKFGLRFFLFSIPIVLLLMYIGSGSADVQMEYPLAKSAMSDIRLFILIEVFYLVYYIGWEFFFRGFMLFGLEKKIGALAAILIQTIPSTIVHIGKPPGEIFGAVVAGLLFGYLAIRTRSIFYPLLIHALLGISTDVFVMIRLTA